MSVIGLEELSAAVADEHVVPVLSVEGESHSEDPGVLADEAPGGVNGENREPGYVRTAAVGGRRGVFGLACGEAVAFLCVMPDASLADEPLQDGADGLVPGCGAFADLALREWIRRGL